MDAVATILAMLAIEKNIAVDICLARTKSRLAGGRRRQPSPRRRLNEGRRPAHVHEHMDDRGSSEDVQLSRSKSAGSLFRVDTAKVNLAPPAATAQWFSSSASISTTATMTIQTAMKSRPSSPGSRPDCSRASDRHLNKALDQLRAGMDDGRLYSVAPSAKDRAAWRVLQRHMPHPNRGTRPQNHRDVGEKRHVHHRHIPRREERKDFEGITGAKRIGEC